MSRITYPPPLEGETPKAYEAFKIYCDLGRDRSIPTVGKELQTRKGGTALGRSSHIADWCRENRWQERVKEYERSIAEVAQAKITEQYGDVFVSRLRSFDKSFDLQQEIGRKLLASIGKLAIKLEDEDPDTLRKSIENVRGLSAAFGNTINALDKTQVQWQNLMGLDQLAKRFSDELESDRLKRDG